MTEATFRSTQAGPQRALEALATVVIHVAVVALLGLGAGGRRIAVLGDMLELGPTAAELHASLAKPLAENRIDLVFASGAFMNHLWPAIAPRQRGGYAGTSSDIAKAVTGAVRAGDIVMIKGSYGSKMRVVVEALRALSTQS